MNNFEEETNFQLTLFQNKELFSSFLNKNDYNLDELIYSTEENNQILKKKRGRKKLGEKRDNINHSNYDNDNIIYKMKVQSMKCINELITNISEKKKY